MRDKFVMIKIKRKKNQRRNKLSERNSNPINNFNEVSFDVTLKVRFSLYFI